MKKRIFALLRAALASFAFACVATLPAMAGDDHNHGAEPAAAEGQASPRVEAHSDLFELVGIVKKGQMTVYLDRYTTNEPVTNAKIEFESGAQKGVAAVQADGTYLIKFDALSKPGELPFSFTVAAGSDTDLLAGDLRIPDTHAHEEAASKPWLRWAGIAPAAFAGLAAALFARRKFASRRAQRTLA
jgi:cobalt-zinc-cadmium efflux system membrane fusion protein